jgi:hypothetical protein
MGLADRCPQSKRRPAFCRSLTKPVPARFAHATNEINLINNQRYEINLIDGNQ